MNSVLTSLLVGSGGFVGANVRYWLGTWIQNRAGLAFPTGTLVINVTGSLLIGIFMGFFLREGWSDNWRLLLVVGVLGGYTTFSSFSYDTLVLVNEGNYPAAFGYVLGSVVLALAGTWVGLLISGPLRRA
jgi:CrcB protein